MGPYSMGLWGICLYIWNQHWVWPGVGAGRPAYALSPLLPDSCTFKRNTWNVCDVSDTVLDAGDTAMTKTDQSLCPHSYLVVVRGTERP